MFCFSFVESQVIFNIKVYVSGNTGLVPMRWHTAEVRDFCYPPKSPSRTLNDIPRPETISAGGCVLPTIHGVSTRHVAFFADITIRTGGELEPSDFVAKENEFRRSPDFIEPFFFYVSQEITLYLFLFAVNITGIRM